MILVGNLGRDPEIRSLETGTKLASFSIATNENYLDKNTGNWNTITEWHNIKAWRRLAESIETRLKKGTLVYVEGKLTHRKYTDKDGVEKYITEVVANVIRVLNKTESDGTNEGGQMNTRTGVERSQASNTSDAPMIDGAKDEEEDDLPF